MWNNPSENSQLNAVCIYENYHIVLVYRNACVCNNLRT